MDDMLRRYEILCDRIGGDEAADAAGRMRGGFYRTRSIRSGSMLEVQAYPLTGIKTRRAVARMEITGEAQRKLNQKNAERRLARLAEANFTEKDYYFTGTLEGAELPGLDEMQKIIRGYMRRWKRARERIGLTEHRYIYVIEGHEDGDRKKRIHWHALLQGGLDRSECKKLWNRGRSRCDELDPRGAGGLIPLARYLSKDPRGKRRWAASKGLKQPTVSVADRKISARAAQRVAGDAAGRAAALEKLYPGYEFVECEVRSNPYIAGVYIYAVMRRSQHETVGRGGANPSDAVGGVQRGKVAGAGDAVSRAQRGTAGKGRGGAV